MDIRSHENMEHMEQIEQQEFRSGRAAMALWWSVLAGPVACALDEGLSYAVVQHACSTGHYVLLHFYTIAAALMALSGLAAAQWSLRRTPSADEKGGSVADRSRWMAIYGIAISVGFTLVIIAFSVPKWTLKPCDQ
jgi:hypothetical protein